MQRDFKTTVVGLGVDSLETPKLLGERGLLELKHDRKNSQLSPFTVFDKKSPTN